jgi:hypothetical protein
MKERVWEIIPFDITTLSEPELRGLWQQYTDFFCALPANGLSLRTIIHSRPFPINGAIDRCSTLVQETGGSWRKKHILDYRRFLEQLGAVLHMRRIEMYVVTWTDDEATANSFAASMQNQLGVGVVPTELPALVSLDTPFTERPYPQFGFFNRRTYLRPDDDRPEMWQILMSHDMRGEWSFFNPVPTLLHQNFPVSIAIDIGTFAPDTALSRLEMSYNLLDAQVNRNRSVVDMRSQRALTTVIQVRHRVEEGGSLHTLSIAVAAQAPTPELLRERVKTLNTAVGSKLKLREAPGEQVEALKFFTTIPENRIAVKTVKRNIEGVGMAVVPPFGIRRRATTDGILWGIDADGMYPIFRNPWNQDRAQHEVIVGETGSGKTFSTMVRLFREAFMHNTQVIILEPMGHSKRFADAVRGSGKYYPLNFDSISINILDPVYDRRERQTVHVITALQLLLSSIGEQRRFSQIETGVLDEALRNIYQHIDTDDPNTAPTLEFLCHQLNHIQHGDATAGKHLAQEIAGVYVDGSLSSVFNETSNVRFDFKENVLCYDFSGIAPTYRTLLYFFVLSRLRYVVLNLPVRERYVMVDEYRVMASEPMLSEAVAEMYKTFRTRRTWLITAEQQLFTYVDGAAGRYALENSPNVFIFRQSSTGLPTVKQTFPQLTERHLNIVASAQPGEALLIMGDSVHHVHIKPSSYEYSVFAGT